MMEVLQSTEIGIEDRYLDGREVTIEEYFALEEGAPYELLGGKLSMSPSPSFFHQRIQYRLANLLDSYASLHNLGIVVGAPLDLRIGDQDVLQPDLIFIPKAKVPLLVKDTLTVVPDLVVEITSPSTAYKDFTRKSEQYCKLGIEEYWIIEPEEERIEVRRKQGDMYQIESLLRTDDSLTSIIFPGLSISVAEIFSF